MNKTIKLKATSEVIRVFRKEIAAKKERIEKTREILKDLNKDIAVKS